MAQQLQQQLWNIANDLRGKMGADEFRDYILGFIFYKYLSEKMRLYADKILQQDQVRYIELDEKPKLLERKPIAKRVIEKIYDFVETFVYGMAA